MDDEQFDFADGEWILMALIIRQLSGQFRQIIFSFFFDIIFYRNVKVQLRLSALSVCIIVFGAQNVLKMFLTGRMEKNR